MTAKQEVEKLMNDLVPFAKRMLSERGEFYPFGGYVKREGGIVHVGAEQVGTDQPKSADLFLLLKQSFQEKARNDECRATAILADVRIVPPGSSQKSDAIQVSLDHKDGYTAEVFYPYRRENGGIVYESIFAQKGDGDIFQ
ncbi:MAG: hypothetical protein ACREIA_18370 [Opitutaceae bacterium]